MGAEGVNDPGPGAETLDVQTSQAAVLTVMRLFRALERVDTGLTPQQYRILKLAGAGGERSARLAERLAVAKPTLTATADGLVAAGYVRRDAEPGDPRGGRAWLKPAGRRVVASPTLPAPADGLVPAGSVRRDAEPGDRRVVRLCLTPAGRRALERADTAYCGWLDRLVEGTSEADRILILHSLTVLDAAMEERRRARHTAPSPATARQEGS